jgi:hypothetical protein
MNDRIILTGVSLLIANLFLLFAGVFNDLNLNIQGHSYNYYVFGAIIIVAIVIGAAGLFAKMPAPKVSTPPPTS